MSEPLSRIRLPAKVNVIILVDMLKVVLMWRFARNNVYYQSERKIDSWKNKGTGP